MISIDYLEKNVMENPSHIFIKTDQLSLTYSEVYSFVLHYSVYITRHYKGDLIAIMIDDQLSFVLTFLSLLHCGKTVMLLNHKNQQLGYMLAKQYHCSDILINIPDNIFDNSTLTYTESKSSFARFCLFTSGTSTEPKCVLHSTYQAIEHSKQSNKELNFTQSSIWLCSLPFFHVSGLSILFRTLVSGGTILLDNINSTNDYTHLSLVSSQVKQFLSSSISSRLHYVLLGGSFIPKQTLSLFKPFNFSVYIGYGMTETFSHIALFNSEESDSNGYDRILNHVKLKIKDNILFVQSTSLFIGYLTKENSVKKIFKQYYSTNDCAELRDNTLYILGRNDYCFKSHGELINPETLEHLISKDTRITSSFFVPFKDSVRENSMCLFVQSDLDHKTIVSLIKKRIFSLYSSLYLPKYIVIIGHSEKMNSRTYYLKHVDSYITEKPHKNVASLF